MTLPAQLERVEFEIAVAGKRFRGGLAAAPNLSYTFNWDGKDIYGRLVQGTQPVTVLIGYVYPIQYAYPANTPAAFGIPCAPTGGGTACQAIASALTGARSEQTLVQAITTSIGTLDATALGLGGFTLDVQHVYDPVGEVLYKGDGTRRGTASLPPGIGRFAGNGAFGFGNSQVINEIPAVKSLIDQSNAIAVGPDGSVYLGNSSRIRRVTPDGIIHAFAGNDTVGYSGDGGPALQAKMRMIRGLAFGPDGSLYAADRADHRVRRIAPNGIITTVAGTGSQGFFGDSGQATLARLSIPQGIDVGPDGSIYIADVGNLRIRRVGIDGVITTFAGDGTVCGATSTDAQFNSACGNGIAATKAKISPAEDVKVGPDGSVYILTSTLNRVRRVAPDGTIRTFAGSANTTNMGDGGLATLAALVTPTALTIGLDGSVYIAQIGASQASQGAPPPEYRVRRVAPTGVITTAAGTTAPLPALNTGDGGLAPAARINNVYAMAVGPDGNLYLMVNPFVRRIRGFLPGFGVGQTVIASEDGSELYVFSAAGRVLLTLSAVRRDTIYRFSYNDSRQIVAITDANGLATTFERNAAGSVTALVAPNGQRTLVTLDDNGHIANVLAPDGGPVGFELDANGMLVGAVNQSGDTVLRYRYDASGQVVGLTNELGGDNLYNASASGGTVSVQSPSYPLAVTDSQLAIGGNKISTTINGQSTVQTIFALDGSAVTTTPDGMTTTLTATPDPLYGMQAPLRRETVRTPSGLTRSARTGASVTLSLSDPGTVTVEVDSLIVNGRASTTRYDKAANTLTTSTAAGRTIVKRFDAQGRLSQVTAPGVAAINQSFDLRGRLAVRSIGSRSTTFGYDSLDRVNRVTDPRGLTRRFVYDAAGRLTERHSPDGRVVRLGYDANGNLTTVTPAGRPAHLMTYNAAAKLATYTPPDTPSVAVLRYTFDAAGRLASILRSDGSLIRTIYDSATFTQTTVLPGGATLVLLRSATNTNVTRMTLTGGASIDYLYDGVLLTGAAWSGPVSGTVTRTYDADFRVNSQLVNGGSQVSFAYDPDGYLTAAGALTMTRAPGAWAVMSTNLAGLRTTYGYNAWSELLSTQATFGSDTLYGFAMLRDSVGRITSRTETIGGTVSTAGFGYDSAGRLVTVTRDGVVAESYEYDANGNRVRATTSAGSIIGVVDARDRLLSYGQTSYQYTRNGELQRRIAGCDTTQYVYDALGSLRAVQLPQGTSIEYVVDGQGRRVGKRVSGVLVKSWLYDGELPVVGELDGTGQIISRFVYGDRVNVPEYMVRSGVTYRIITDERGSVRFVADASSGSVIQQLDYDAFGRVTRNTNPGFQPFGFAGGLYDEQTGLVRFGSRDYDAEIGRWLGRDPLLFSGGDENLYAYAQDDPVNLVDPNGRQFWLGVGIGAAIGLIDGLISSDRSWESLAKSTLYGAIGGAAGGIVGPMGGILERVVTNVVARLFVSGAIAGGVANIALQLAEDGEIKTGPVIQSAIVGAMSAGIGNMWAGRIIKNGTLTYAHLEHLEAVTSSIVTAVLELGAKRGP